MSSWIWKGDGVLHARLYFTDSSTVEISPRETNEQLRIECEFGVLKILSSTTIGWNNVFVCSLDKIIFFELKRKDAKEVTIKYNKSQF